MTVAFARPDVASLMFHVFDRSIHPELVEVHAGSRITHGRYGAAIQICNAGHVVTFRAGQHTITEVAAPNHQLLPLQNRRVGQRLRGCRDEFLNFKFGVQYHVSFQVERLDREVFLEYHDELQRDCQRAEVAYRFPAGNRLSPAPLSLLVTDCWPNSLLIHSFHTFPDNCAVVKTQSLFEF